MAKESYGHGVKLSQSSLSNTVHFYPLVYNLLMQPNTLKTKPLLKSLGIDADDSMKNYVFHQLFTVYVSDAQMAALEKAVKYGWKVSKIVYSNDPSENTCALAMYSGDCAAWMLPDGTIDRAKVGQRRAVLNKKWTESA
jgi:hypothetical protein